MLTDRVEILETTKEGSVLLGDFAFDDEVGLVVYDPRLPNRDLLFESILSREMLTIDFVEVSADEFPKQWLEALPRNISGAYLRARKV